MPDLADASRGPDRQLNTLLDSLPDLVARFDLEGRHLYGNPALVRTFGVPLAQFVGKTALEVGASSNLASNTALVAAIRRAGVEARPNTLEVEFQTVAGPRTFEVRHLPEADEHGRVVSVVGIARDITETRRAEVAAIVAERGLAMLINAVPDLVCQFDTSGRFVNVSPSVLRAMGGTLDAILGRSPVELAICVDAADDRRLADSISRVLATGQPEYLEVGFRSPTGPRGFAVRHLPELADGAVVGVLGIATDVTDRRAADRQLSLLEYAFEHVGEGLFLMEDDTPRFTHVNGSAAATLGYTRAELVGKTIYDIDPEWTPERWAEVIPELHRRQRLTIETTHRTRDGRAIPVEVTSNHFELDGRHYILAIVRDISARRAAEAAAAKYAEGYRALAENTPDMIIRWDRELRRTYVNPAFAKAVGLPAEEIIGSILGTQYTPGVTTANTAYLRELAAKIRSVFATGEPVAAELPWSGIYGKRIIDHRLVAERGPDGQITTVLGIGRDLTRVLESEAQLRTLTENSPDLILRFAPDGRYRFVNRMLERVTGIPVERFVGRLVGEVTPGPDGTPLPADLELRRHIAEVGRGGGPRETELAQPLADGVHTFNLRLIGESGDDGHIASVLVVARDVTVQRGLEVQLRQAQKMEAVGQLAGGIAHDFNNMLAIILMNASLLAEEPNPPELDDGLRQILDATDRAANLTRQLLTFSRQQITRPVNLDISEVIGDMTRLLRRVLGETIALETRFAPALPIIHADSGMMEQVLMNLGINARDAMHEGGCLTVALEAVVVTEARAALHAGASPGPHVALTVTDTGCGISAVDLPRIFEPFFTTKQLGKGTGLGLATVFGIVQQHHGWIEVESAVGSGTTFRVLLPALASWERVPASVVAPNRIRGGTETILLVEDEQAVRDITRNILERLGYRVLVADSAAAALDVWSAAHDIALLLTDLVMPGGLSGRQLAERLLGRDPALAVIYMSGYSPDVVGQLHLDETHALLEKPFATTDLATVVRRSLDDRRARATR